ncbi:helix-turn-helix domain-containing protein [Variovorax sp. J2P1-59]|uniref:helix-turn-helix domain-containing protein n=1 Tax=Variovorax flavidus TaxID=3053501 RepID=UPI002578B353|nr:helix-turn-helix domain-containing protein [Variovorax sp. J2P1-59]MDM0075394.1 helix-turn-helix domain-containing protein [Variovorax sp. J2P1-59]
MSTKNQPRYAELSKQLLGLREAAGIATQAEIANLLGVKQQTVSRWEAGTSRPKASEIPKLAALLRVDAITLSNSAGYAPEVTTVSFDRPLPLAGLSPESFEYFSLDLLSTIHRGQADVHLAGKTGHKQHGIDIEATFPDGTSHTYQCKREAQFGAAKVRDAIKAQTTPAKKKIILLSRVASPEARNEIKKARGWSLWDQTDISRIFRTLPKAEQVRIADIFFPSQRFALTGENAAGPWLSVADFFAPQLAEGRIFNQRWDLVGRGVELRLLASALANQSIVAVSLVGRAGEGKSRVLRSALDAFVAAHPETAVRMTSPTEEINAKSLEDLGIGAKLIVVDDAHDRSDLGQLIRYAANGANHARLLLAYRPYWSEVVERDLARMGITETLAVSVTLQKPSKDEAIELAPQVLVKHGAPTHAASAIADLAYDSPLAVVVGAQIVAKEGVHPQLFGSNNEFRATVLKHYERMIAEGIAVGRDQEKVHAMLGVIALVQPVVPDDRHVLELLSSIEGISAPDATRLARQLIDSGVLFKRGSRYRLSPDLLADSIIETSCITSSGQSNGYAERVLAATIPEHKEHILINLGRLDWRRNEGDTSSSRLLDGLWGQLAWEDGYDHPQVRAAASAAYYQPRQALKLARRLVEEGHGRNEDVCTIVRNAAFTLAFVLEACALLWEVGRSDPRATNPHPSHPIRILTELATPEPRKPIEFVHRVVEFALAQLDEPESWTGTYTPFDVLRGALATEGDFTSAYSSRQITISQYAVQRDRVKDVRKQVIDELFASLTGANERRAFLAAQTLSDALRGPIRAHGGSDDAWGEEFAATLSRLDDYLDTVKVSAPVVVRIAESVNWHAVYGPDRTQEVAKRIVGRLDRDIETRTVRALMDAWGTNTRLIKAGAGRSQHETATDAVVRELNGRFAVPAELTSFLNGRLSDIRQATGNVNLGPAQIFIGRVLSSNLELSRHVVDAGLVGDASPMAAHAGRALGALLTASHDEGNCVVEKMLGVGDTHLLLIAEGYMLSSHPVTYSETDLTALRRIFSSEDGLVLRHTTNIAMEVARRDKSLAVDLLSSANIELAMLSARDYFMWLSHEETIPFAQIRDDQLRKLIDGLRNVPRLDDHWVNGFLKKAIQRVPEAVVDLAKARIDASIANEDWNMQPLGSVLREHDALNLLALPDGPRLLRGLLEWALGRVGDYQFSYRFAELVQSLCSPYDTTCVATIEDWLTAGGTADHFKAVTVIVRDAGPSFIFDHEAFVGRALRAARTVGRKDHRDLSSALFASSVSGVRTGIPGQPFEVDVRLKELAEERLARIARSDAAYDLYVTLRDHAGRDIERQIAEGRRMDEEDSDT